MYKVWVFFLILKKFVEFDVGLFNVLLELWVFSVCWSVVKIVLGLDDICLGFIRRKLVI